MTQKDKDIEAKIIDFDAKEKELQEKKVESKIGRASCRERV